MILMYHRVGEPPSDVHQLSVPAHEFAEHLRYLSSACQPIALAALAAAVRSGEMPENAVAITFDDGYVDNLQVASPMLLEHGIPATFFVTTERLDEGVEFWWDALERLVLGPDIEVPGALELDLCGDRYGLDTRTDADRRHAHGVLYRRLAAMSSAEQRLSIECLTEWAGASGQPWHRRMTDVEIAALASRPCHEIGAHTVTHSRLTQLDERQQRYEACESQRALQRLTGAPVTAFSYPFGDYDRRAREMISEAFATAVTARPSLIGPSEDPLELPRFHVTHQRSRQFAGWVDEALGL
jgi:peptidoglycan/xylan/chitin deacetylase (PgdA/CDA1 family)